ncbi:hypothetical protein D8S78_05760 [Natrialba swarupiae]|nr:hypothetical protein [Natrialba swarupiae]
MDSRPEVSWRCDHERSNHRSRRDRLPVRTGIDGARDGIDRLRDAGVDVAFVTNSATKSRRKCLERLESIGIDADESEILTSATVTASYVAKSSPTRRRWPSANPRCSTSCHGPASRSPTIRPTATYSWSEKTDRSISRRSRGVFTHSSTARRSSGRTGPKEPD